MMSRLAVAILSSQRLSSAAPSSGEMAVCDGAAGCWADTVQVRARTANASTVACDHRSATLRAHVTARRSLAPPGVLEHAAATAVCLEKRRLFADTAKLL